MIAKGKHKATKAGGDFGFTSGGGEQVGISFQLTETGDSITWYGYFTEKTRDSTCKTLANLGVKPDLSNVGESNDIEVTLVVEHEENNEGQMVAKVRWVNIGDGVAMSKRMDQGQRAAFASRIGGLIAKAASGQPPVNGVRAPQGNGRRPDVADDDIPF